MATCPVSAMISNRDIGFVSEGAKAQIKVDTFNFTRYGLRHGTVLSVSHDAISRQKQCLDILIPKRKREHTAKLLNALDA